MTSYRMYFLMSGAICDLTYEKNYTSSFIKFCYKKKKDIQFNSQSIVVLTLFRPKKPESGLWF